MKNVRTLVVGMIAGAVLATAGSAYGASAIEKVTAMVRPDYKVKVDGQAVSMQHAPLSYNGTTYVPLREAGEILGYNVGFNAGTISLDQKEGTTVTEPTTTPVETEQPSSNESQITWVSLDDLTKDHGVTQSEAWEGMIKITKDSNGDSFLFSAQEADGEYVVANKSGSVRIKYEGGKIYLSSDDLTKLGFLAQ